MLPLAGMLFNVVSGLVVDKAQNLAKDHVGKMLDDLLPDDAPKTDEEKTAVNYTERTVYKKDNPIKIVHHCTPWRGLSVLLGAMQLVKNPLVSLDVYSSCEVYGKSFHDHNDHYYHELYDQAKQLPNVNYIGYKPNEYIKEHLKDYRMFVYPSIWEETSCISLLESMSAGLYCITTNYGAIYETGAEFPVYVPYSSDYKSLARKFAKSIEVAADTLHSTGIRDHLEMQKDYVNKFYDWSIRSINWTTFLQGAINAK